MNKVYKTSEKNRATSKAWYDANPERTSAYSKKYYKANKEEINARNKVWHEANKEKTNARSTAWYEANKEEANAQSRDKYASDIPYKLSKLVRDACIRATGKGAGKQEAIDLLGCTPEEYKEYLESKFQQGMTWDNHTVDGWHIDHILPLNESGTTLTEEEKLKRLHYKNTQPLWAKDNMKKGNKLKEDNDV